jgi:non-ribosomal peptide synthetase component F
LEAFKLFEKISAPIFYIFIMDQPQQTAFEKDVLEGPVLLGERRSTSNTSFLELPIDFPRSPAILYQVNHVFFSLPSYCWRALKQICNQQNTTPFTALLATYNTLLFRYTKQEDIVIGSPTPENTFDEEGELPGFHYNTKLFRTDLSGNPRFDELLKRVHQTVLTVNGNKDISYETLEESMRLKMGANYPGLYNITFSYKNAEFENNKINDLAANINLPENYRGNIDLALSVKETTKGLKGVWTYNSGLFKTATIKRLAKHFEVLLQSIVSNPEQTISQLQLLTSTEINQLTFEWNSSTVNYPANKCIHELFEEQVEKTPGATALVFENERLTYAELNERANQLAAHLCKKGVRQETLVPICIGRSLEMIIGILAILKAGGVYVPIDPDYPTERITYLLEDTRASLVVCGKKSKTQLQAFHNIDLVELSNEGYFLKNEPTDNLNINLSSNNLAYVIYTSGSTGKPKGVMIEHRALIDHCYGVIESANLSTCKSFALFSPLVFDAGHSIIHSSLIIGACLHVLSDDIIMSSEKIATYFDNNDIDCIKIVPSLWLSYANLKKTVLPKKIVIFGGEAFPLSILNYFGKLNFRGNIYNHYGPT